MEIHSIESFYTPTIIFVLSTIGFVIWVHLMNKSEKGYQESLKRLGETIALKAMVIALTQDEDKKK